MTESPTVRLGQPVPDFTLKTYDPVKDDFGSIHLADLKTQGKWTILFFYPADFTFVCATEFAALAAQYEKFQKLGAEVITVSTDTEYVHLAWKRHEQELQDVRYPMGSDRTGEVSKLFGVYDPESGSALRGVFIINPEGTLLSSEVTFFNLGRNIDELMRKFKANIYLARRSSEACPAGWKNEGDATLTPSARLVGRVHEALGGK